MNKSQYRPTVRLLMPQIYFKDRRCLLRSSIFIIFCCVVSAYNLKAKDTFSIEIISTYASGWLQLKSFSLQSSFLYSFPDPLICNLQPASSLDFSHVGMFIQVIHAGCEFCESEMLLLSLSLMY